MTELKWYNEPPAWKAEGHTISLTSGAKTDFWRKTHDGGIRDHGHFYYRPVSGDFVADVTFSANYEAQYDQAGLMVRLDESTWLKCGIEFFEGVQHVSAVVTHDFSDWSIVPLAAPPSRMQLRLVREGHTVAVYYSLDGTTYKLLRQAYLTPAPVLEVGLMACSPTGEGGVFTAVFENFAVK